MHLRSRQQQGNSDRMAMETGNISMVRVAEIQGRGRALISTQSIQGGQILLQDTPLLLYSEPNTNQSALNPNPEPPMSFCGHCFTSLLPSPSVTPSCPSCIQPLVFCTVECQTKAHSSSHTQWVCKALNILNCSSLDPDTQTQVRFLIAAYNLAIVSPADFQLLLLLQGEGTVDSQTQLVHSFMGSVLQFWPLQGLAGFSLELTGSLLAKDKHNAFGLMAPVQKHGERKVRAYAIYAQASFFNHDCLPNACRFDYLDKPGDHNTDIIIRALHDIPEGTEICLSYFPINWPYAERQKRLLEDYGFACKCDRCRIEEGWSDKDSMDEEDTVSLNEMEDEEMEIQDADEKKENANEGEDDFPHAFFFVKYLCPIDNCGGTLAPLPPALESSSTVMECNMCGHLRTDDEFTQDLKEHGMDY